MSDASRRSTTSRPSSRGARPDTNALRPLAPRPSPSALTSSSETSPSVRGSATWRSPPPCAICFKVGCQLATHRAYGQPARADTPSRGTSGGQASESDFTASYAFSLGLQYVDADIAATKIDPFYNLPIKPELNTPEMHRLFHSCEYSPPVASLDTDPLVFTVESQAILRIPRPPEIVGDLICGPFFLPAMQDPALCLSILATAAAIVPCRNGRPARNVMSLTLFGETMQLMRNKIDLDPKHISDTTIAAATFLWAVNAWLEDEEALRSHGESVFAFIKTRGGMSRLGFVGAVAQLVRWVDLLSCTILAQPCRFNDAVDPTDAFPELSSTYGTYWDEVHLSMAVELDDLVTSACQSTCKLISCLEQGDREGLSAAQFTYIVEKLCALGTTGANLRAQHHGTGSVNECVCLAIILIKMKCFHGNENLKILVVTNASHLARAIGATGNPERWKDEREFLIWLLFAALIVQQDFDGRQWCCSLLREVLSSIYHHAEFWPAEWKTDIKSTLHQFVWSDTRLSTIFDDICESINQSRNPNLLSDGTEDEDMG